MVRHPCVGRHGQIADDADHFVPAVRFRAVQPLAVHRTDVPETVSERVAAGGDGVGEVAVDDDRIGLRRDVALGESAADQGRHLIHLEKGGIDLVEPGGEARQPPVERLGRRVAAFDVDEHPGFLAGRAQGGRYVENARVGQKPSRQLALAIAKERGALSPALFERDTCGRKLLGGEARADGAGSQRAPGEFGGQRQHADREGDLRDHQRGPRGAQPQAGPSGERAGAEPRQAPRGLERRHEAGHGGPSHGQSGDEEKGAVRNVEGHPERRATGDVLQAPGHHDRHDAQDQQGDTGGRGRQHERLDEELPDDPRAAAAEGVAGGELLLPRDGARVVQDRDVRAGRQQQQYERETGQRPEQAQLAAVRSPP